MTFFRRRESIRELLNTIINQNVAILKMLENRTHLSPEDQARLDEIYRTERSDARKIDDAMK